MATARAKRSSLAAVADALLVQERDEALAKLEVANARQESLACALRDLIGLVDPKAHLWPSEQQALRYAAALLAEGGK